MKLDDNWKPIGEAAKRVGDKLAREFVDRMYQREMPDRDDQRQVEVRR